MSQRILIAGCGDVGCRAAATLVAAGHAVTGLRRSPDGLPAGVHGAAADLTDPATLTAVAGGWDVVVFAPAPSVRTAAGYREIFVQGLANLLGSVTTQRLLFVASTAVYGQDDGRWVDESSETAPPGFNGQELLVAEALAMATVSEPITLRLGGIYGPGRDRLLRTARAASGQPTARTPAYWTNRIHRDDAGDLVAFLATLGNPRRRYNGVDDEPAPRFEVLAWLARELGLAPPEPVQEPGTDRGKRVSNRRIREAGFRFAYPDFRSGYGALLAAGEGG